LQEKKQDAQITSTELGILIEGNPQREKASSLIRDNLECTSNVTDSSCPQEKKQDRQITSTEPGIMTEGNPL
jgi:hypothetical protein